MTGKPPNKGDSDKGPPIRVIPPREGGGTVSVDEILARLSGSGGEEVPPAEKEVKQKGLAFVGEGFPPIPANLVLAIGRGEYVDLAELLPQSPSYEEQYTEVAENVVVVSQSKHIKKKKVIKDIETWIQAFCTFIAVRCKKDPEHTPDLLAYAASIVKGAKDFGGTGWLSYDYQYRRLAAAKNSVSGWGQKDVVLWNEVFLKPGSSASLSGSNEPELGDRRPVTRKRSGEPQQPTPGPKKSKQKDKSWKGSVCYAYSYGGKCSREGCQYLHICYMCGEGHPQISCPKKDSGK